MVKAMKAIAEAGVRLLDIQTQNFLVIRETVLSVVAIDFAGVDFGYDSDKDRLSEVHEVCKRFIFEFNEYEDAVQDWIFENLPEDERVFGDRRIYRSQKGYLRY